MIWAIVLGVVAVVAIVWFTIDRVRKLGPEDSATHVHFSSDGSEPARDRPAGPDAETQDPEETGGAAAR